MATEVVSDSAKLVSHKRVIAEREQTIETLRADNERLRAALAEIKGMVCGDRYPRWSPDGDKTTRSRGIIADICDRALEYEIEALKAEGNDPIYGGLTPEQQVKARELYNSSLWLTWADACDIATGRRRAEDCNG